MNDRKRLGGKACVGVTTLLIAATAHAQTAPPPQPPPAPAPTAPAPRPAPAPPAPAPTAPAPAPTAPAPAPTAPAPAPTAPAPTAPAPAPTPDPAAPTTPTAPTPEPAPVATPPAPVTEPAPPPPAAEEPVLTEEELLELSEEQAKGEIIVVTGSRISDPVGDAAPVLQISREDLERTGLVSVGDILQRLPSSGGAINSKSNSSGNFGAPPDGGGIGAGAIEADLRYLGSKRVLVLVDGVRWINGSSASGIAASTDLNTIPLGMIERIEVLEDGASPIYGSDAIAGVINIITRKEFSGVVASAHGGVYHQGDGFTQKYDVAWGNTTDKLTTVVSASFLDQSRVNSIDRDISDFPTPDLDQCTRQCSSATPQARILYTVLGTGESRDITLNTGAPQPTPGLENYHDFAIADRFNFAPYNLVQTPSRRINVSSSVLYRLPRNVRFSAKAVFTNRQSENQAAPEPLFVGPEGGSYSRMDRIKIDVTNPYNPFGFTFDPATMSYFVARRPIEAGPRLYEQNVNTLYTSAGFDGGFNAAGRRFTWDATLAYGTNRGDQRRNNSFNSAKLEQALGPAYRDGQMVWRCGTEASPGDPNCVPFNLFGGMGPDGRGTITPEMLKYVTYTQHDSSEQELVDLVGNVSAQVVQLPGGWLAVAAGVEHRRLDGFFEPDAVVAAGDTADIPAGPARGDYSVTEAYAELRLPIVSGVVGAELLDLSAAGRVSKYSFLDTELTGKVGVRYKPIKDLVVRASYGLGFRVPSIGELYGTLSRYDADLADPCSSFGENNVPADVQARCVELGVPADGSYEQVNDQISVVTSGNRGLEPETSKSLNLSFAFSPSFVQGPWVDGIDAELTYYDIRIDDAIGAVDAQFQIDQCVLGRDPFYCSTITRNPTGSISGFSNILENQGGIETRGFDITLAYRMPMKPFGRFRVTSLSNVLVSYWDKVRAFDGERRIEREGTVGGEPERVFPRFKSTLGIEWQRGGLAASLFTRYIHSVTEPCLGLAEFPGTCSDPAPVAADSTNELSPTVYNDVQVMWTPEFEPGLTVSAGVNNVFNVDPPACFSCALNGFAGATYDVPGVFGYLNASYHVQ
jgi:iron complex outermembrane receptor protein